jgi:murein hydrolase activator
MKAVSSIIIILISFLATAQKSSAALKKEQDKIERQINNTKSLLNANRDNLNSEISTLNLINSKISNQQRLISNYSRQIKTLAEERKANEARTNELISKITRLKKEYAKLVRFSYKYRSKESSLLYVLSSKSITESYRKLKFIQQLKNNLKSKMQELRQTRIDLEKAKKEINQSEIDIKKAQTSKKTERNEILKSKESRQEILQKIKEKGEGLQKELLAQEKKKRKMDRAISKAIAAEIKAEQDRIKRERELARKKQGNNSKPAELGPTADALIAGKSFAANKGRLPWPVLTGNITGKYGKHPHPAYANLMVENNGVDITTKKNADVRTVFKGKVTSILNIPGNGKVVIITHGTYRTVYANVKETIVKIGDVVQARQKIGVLLENKDGNNSIAHLEVWNEDANGIPSKLNPSLWLAK